MLFPLTTISPDLFDLNYRREKSNIGFLMEASKVHVKWWLIIEGDEYLFEVSHSQITGRKRVFVNSQKVISLGGLEQFADCGLHYVHNPRISGRIMMNHVDSVCCEHTQL